MKRTHAPSSDQKRTSSAKRKKIAGPATSPRPSPGHQDVHKSESSRSVHKSNVSSEDKEINSDNSRSADSSPCTKQALPAPTPPATGLTKTTATVSSPEANLKAEREKTAFSLTTPPADPAEWQSGEFTLKQSRVDSEKYQAAVPNEPTGTLLELDRSFQEVKSRCQLDTKDSARLTAVDDFLQFVRWLANERANTGGSGPWLNGSIQDEQFSLRILHAVDYSVAKAKFWLLFPAATKAKPSPLQTLPEEALLGHVDAAVRSMMGYKKEEYAKLVAHILEQLNGPGMDMTELEEYFALFEKHEWDIPVEIEGHRLKAQEKSAKYKQLFETKTTFEETLAAAEEAEKEEIRTPETKLVIEVAEKAKRWVEKAQSIQKKWVAMKTLQRLVNEAKGLPVSLPFVDEVRQRYDKAHECMTNLYKLLKSSKTRTGNNSERRSEEEIEKVIKEADQIKFTNPDLEKQKEYLEKIKEWKNKVAMTFEDHRTEKTLEIINALLKETLDFKFTVKQIAELEAIAAAYKWAQNVTKELNGKNSTTMEILQGLITEGKAHQYDTEKVKQMSELLHNATHLKNAIQRVIKSDKVINADYLEELHAKADAIPVDIKEKAVLSKLLGEARNWREKCTALLKGKCRVEDLEEVKKEAELLNVTCAEYTQLCELMQPVLQWLLSATKFLSKFTVRSKTVQTVDHAASEIKKKSSHTTHLQTLLESANETSKATGEFHKLESMRDQLVQWEASADQIIQKYTQETTFSKEEIHGLLLKALEHPVNKTKGLQLLDILDHELWVQKAKDAIEHKVPLHVLETILREGNAFSVKTEEIAFLLKKIEEKVVGAKKWSANYKQLKASLEENNSKMQIQDLERILKEGEGLNVKIREIEWLGEVFAEVKDLQRDAQLALQGNTTFTALEGLIQKIEDYDVHLEELGLLKALYEVCAVWRKIALQVIRSRQALSLALLNSLPEEAQPKKIEDKEEVVVILNKNDHDGYDLVDIKADRGLVLKDEVNLEETVSKDAYCVCRKGDEEERHMIACDFCDEWFHLECINLTKEMANNLPHFICPACVRRRQLSFSYTNSLDSIARITEKEYEKLLNEGHKLPIQFMELKLLEQICNRIERWKAKARKVLAYGLQYQLYIEALDPKKEKHKREAKLKDLAYIEEALMKLYLESENFPVEIKMSHQVMHLLMIKDWVRETLKCKNQPKISQRKCKALIDQAQSLDVLSSFPELEGIYKELIAFCNKPQLHPSESMEDQSNIMLVEGHKEEIKHSNGYRTDESVLKLQNALRNAHTPERDLYQICQELSTVKNVNPELLKQARIVLANAERFRKRAIELYAASPNDPQNLEIICQASLNVGCVPENTEELWEELRRLKPESHLLLHKPSV